MRGEANPSWGSRSEGESEQGVLQSRVLDPKRDDLALGRLKRGDDLGLGVKGQSNSVIAGSLRNAFRCSVGLLHRGGRATGCLRALVGYQQQPNSEYR